MYEKLFAALSRELRTRPVTLVTIVVLCAFSGFSWMEFARADDLGNLRDEVIENRRSIESIVHDFRRSSIESKIDDTERELFFLSRVIVEKEGRGEQVDEIYHQRVHELQQSIDTQQRELARLDTAKNLREAALQR